VKIVPNN